MSDYDDESDYEEGPSLLPSSTLADHLEYSTLLVHHDEEPLDAMFCSEVVENADGAEYALNAHTIIVWGVQRLSILWGTAAFTICFVILQIRIYIIP